MIVPAEFMVGIVAILLLMALALAIGVAAVVKNTARIHRQLAAGPVQVPSITGSFVRLMIVVGIAGAIFGAAALTASDSLLPESGARVSVCRAAGEVGCIPAKFQQPLRVQ